jgi:hypothetical protein
VVRSHGNILIVVQKGDRAGAYNYLLVRKHSPSIAVLETEQHLLTLRKVQSICAIFNVISLAFTCFSVICLYIRLFGLDDKFLRNARILIAISASWGVGSALGALFICTPPSNLWNLKDLDKCGDYNVFMLCIGILEILLLTSILLLPVKPIIRLNLALHTRVSILATFLVGSL